MNISRPVIGITMGDPAGIGPEIIIKALEDPDIQTLCKPVVIGDTAVMNKAVDLVNSPLKLYPIEEPARFSDQGLRVNLIPLSDLDPGLCEKGAPTPATGRAMEGYIIKGVDLALAGEIQAIVTAPITKTGLKLAGSEFHGHTELIAHRTQTANFAMMMAGNRLKVVLATIHIPLARVPDALTREEIQRIIDLTHQTLITRFGIARPRLAVAGLNPHAGEEGMFGNEEARIITPTVEAARARGMDIEGPLPPDTAYFHAVNGRFDAVVSMYHDQGLIPFKMIHFRDGVNTTLGLPIIRTSVDHGTAYDIAWQGKADATSLKEAIKMAVLQAGNIQSKNNADGPQGP